MGFCGLPATVWTHLSAFRDLFRLRARGRESPLRPGIARMLGRKMRINR